MICTFFGHKTVPREIEGQLRRLLSHLIVNQKVDMFYVGNQGNFDVMVRNVLRSMKRQYPHIRYGVVLAQIPSERLALDWAEETLFPEGMENVPPRYAIDRRNMWMLNQATFVVTYVTRTVGGAFKFKELAYKRGKKVINVTEWEREC